MHIVAKTVINITEKWKRRESGKATKIRENHKLSKCKYCKGKDTGYHSKRLVYVLTYILIIYVLIV